MLYCSAVCWEVFQLIKCINDPVKASSVIFILFPSLTSSAASVSS